MRTMTSLQNAVQVRDEETPWCTLAVFLHPGHAEKYKEEQEKEADPKCPEQLRIKKMDLLVED